MNILETEIVSVNQMNNCTLYLLKSEQRDILFGTLPYSKENDFMVNSYGVRDDLKLGKKVYVDVNDNNEVISLVNNQGDVCVTTFILANIEGAYKFTYANQYVLEKYNMSLDEYTKTIKYEIRNGYSLRKIKIQK